MNITYPLLRGYSVVIYNGNKYTMIKLQWGKNIYMSLCTVIKNVVQSIYLREVSKKVGGDF